MSKFDIKEVAQSRANQTKKTVEPVKPENPKSMEISRVVDISKEVVMEFYRYASQTDKNWIRKRMSELLEEKGSRKYFVAFRSEFAKRFFPSIFVNGRPRRIKTMLELFDEIDRETK